MMLSMYLYYNCSVVELLDNKLRTKININILVTIFFLLDYTIFLLFRA
jgi:hypothetical protein